MKQKQPSAEIEEQTACVPTISYLETEKTEEEHVSHILNTPNS